MYMYQQISSLIKIMSLLQRKNWSITPVRLHFNVLGHSHKGQGRLVLIIGGLGSGSLISKEESLHDFTIKRLAFL